MSSNWVRCHSKLKMFVAVSYRQSCSFFCLCLQIWPEMLALCLLYRIGVWSMGEIAWVRHAYSFPEALLEIALIQPLPHEWALAQDDCSWSSLSSGANTRE